VQIAQAADEGLVDRGVVLDLEGGVLGGELVQRVRDLLLVAPALGLDRERVHGGRKLERHEMNLVFVMRIVQHRVEMNLVHLGDRPDVARDERVGLDEVLALQQVGVADLECLAAFADEELRVLGDRALVDAKHPHLADVGVDHHLEDVRDHVLPGIGLCAHRLDLVTRAPDELRRVAFRGVGQELDDDVEQLRDAGAIARRNEAHRNQVALAQRLLERRMQLFRRHLALFEIFRHQFLVHLDDLVDQRAVRFLHRGEICRARRTEEAVHHPLAAVGGQVDRQALPAEGGLDLGEQPRQIHVLGVDLVDDDHAAEIALARPLHHAIGDHLDAVLGVHHDGGGLHRGQRPDGAADEIGQSRGVDEMDARVLVLQVHDRSVERVLELLLDRVEVADGGALFHGSDAGDRPGPGEEGLGERGLAGAAVTGQGDGPDRFRGKLGHGRILRPSSRGNDWGVSRV
jgi:hypothetical protein